MTKFWKFLSGRQNILDHFKNLNFFKIKNQLSKKWEKVALQSPPPMSALAIGFVTWVKMEHGCGLHQLERLRSKETKMKIKQKKTNWNYRQSFSLEAEKIIELKDGKESTYSGTFFKLAHTLWLAHSKSQWNDSISERWFEIKNSEFDNRLDHEKTKRIRAELSHRHTYESPELLVRLSIKIKLEFLTIKLFRLGIKESNQFIILQQTQSIIR